MLQRVEQLTSELGNCLLTLGGLNCDLAQAMTSTYVDMAQQHVGTLSRLTDDDQDPSPTVKLDIERFLWEYLANRTFTGEPRLVTAPDGKQSGCNFASLKCNDDEVCCSPRLNKDLRACCC
jgi:hypothetical protein